MYNGRKVICILLASGKGERFSYHLPKQFFKLKDKTILEYTLTNLSTVEEIDEIILVSNSEFIDESKNISRHFKKVSKVVSGGRTRSISSRNGVLSVEEKNSYILIHDAVRPIVTKELVRNLLEKVEETGSVIPCIRSNDMLLEVENGYFKKVIDRNHVLRVQTPQCFKHEIIYNVYRERSEEHLDYPDDSSIVAENGFKVKIIEGDTKNIKITTKYDIELVEKFLEKGA